MTYLTPHLGGPEPALRDLCHRVVAPPQRGALTARNRCWRKTKNKKAQRVKSVALTEAALTWPCAVQAANHVAGLTARVEEGHRSTRFCLRKSQYIHQSIVHADKQPGNLIHSLMWEEVPEKPHKSPQIIDENTIERLKKIQLNPRTFNCEGVMRTKFISALPKVFLQKILVQFNRHCMCFF